MRVYMCTYYFYSSHDIDFMGVAAAAAGPREDSLKRGSRRRPRRD